MCWVSHGINYITSNPITQGTTINASLINDGLVNLMVLVWIQVHVGM